MSRWTNDRWLSTPHQVVFEPRWRLFGNRRQSLAFFHNLNNDANVSAIPTCLNGQEPKYPPILAHDILMQKHLASTRQQPTRADHDRDEI